MKCQERGARGEERPDLFLILDNLNPVSFFITKTSCNRTYPRGDWISNLLFN